MIRILSKAKLILGVPAALILLAVVAACTSPTPVEVIKEVEVVVEKIVEVEKAPRAETPQISSVRWKGAAPSTYTESPQNAKLSAAGTIPALSERLPKTPLLMHGPDGVGKHGLRAKDLHNKNDMQNCCMVHDGLVDMAINGSELEPNVAKSWEVDSS